MAEDNCKYLIKDKELSDMYLQKGTIASYSSNLANAIHDKLPSHISERGDCETEVIRSDNPRFWKILEERLQNNSNEINTLEETIQGYKQRSDRKKKESDSIKKYFDGTENFNE